MLVEARQEGRVHGNLLRLMRSCNAVHTFVHAASPTCQNISKAGILKRGLPEAHSMRKTGLQQDTKTV